MLNVLALATVIGLIVVGLFITNLTTETQALKSRVKFDSSIVRLHDAETGRFFCSGVIISNTRMLTAAHCVVDASFFGVSVTKRVEIRLQDNKPIGLFADYEAANGRQDLASLTGDFRGLDKRPVITNSAELNRIFMDPASKIVMCGYPNSGPLRCNYITQVGRKVFFMSGEGWLYPGMSGGPVIDQATGAVLAVNTAVTEDGKVVLSPLIELFDNLRLNEAPNKQQAD